MNKGFQKILDEYQQLTEQMSSGGDFDLAKTGKRQAELLPIVEKIQTLSKCETELKDNQELLENQDEEIKNMALEEIHNLESKILVLTEEIETLLIPKDERDENNTIIEMRAGAGGDEASLFVAEMFRAYSKYIS